MSVLIKGMEMPDRPILIKISPNETAIVYDDEPYETDCFEIKPHGRLIDADAVNAEIERNVRKYYNECGGGYYLAEEAQYEVQCAPTIIEAEEEPE